MEKISLIIIILCQITVIRAVEASGEPCELYIDYSNNLDNSWSHKYYDTVIVPCW